MINTLRLSAAACLFALLTPTVQGQTPAPPAPPEPDATALAKATQNPVSDIISVPFQFNFNGGGAFQDQTFFNLNFQPVIPIHITPRVILISRTIVLIDSIPVGNGISYSGIGDIQQQIFFTPARPGKIIWDLGPAFSFPTATLGSREDRHVGRRRRPGCPREPRTFRHRLPLQPALSPHRL